MNVIRAGRGACPPVVSGGDRHDCRDCRSEAGLRSRRKGWYGMREWYKRKQKKKKKNECLSVTLPLTPVIVCSRVGSRVAVRSVQSLTASIARGERAMLLGLLPAARPIGHQIASAASARVIAARLAPVVRSVRSSAGEAAPAQAGPAGFFDRASDRLKALGACSC